MRKRFEAFIEAHPEGWDHRQWLNLVSELEGDGVDVSDPESLGDALERERLAWTLRRADISGLGPKRIEAIVERFGNLWSLQQADAADVASIKTIHDKLAEKVAESVR